MSTIVVDTGIIKKNIDFLIDEKKYFYGKKSVFTRASYGASGLLSKYLLKVNQIYSDISSNIENLSNFLNDYVNDVDGLENILSSKGGYVKADEVSSLVYKNKNSIRLSFIDEGNLFNVVSYTANSGSTVNYDEVNPIKRGFATAGISVLAFGEGIINVGEMVIDGVGSAASGVCSIFGSDATADSIMGFVEKDISGDIYHKVVSATGLDKYGNPDGAVAGIARIAGNIIGMAVLTVATMGAASGISSAAVSGGLISAETGGALTTGLTIGLNAGASALRDAGSGAEIALMRGASTSEAEIVSLASAGIGAITGGVLGKINTLAKGATGVGQIIKYGIASFSVGSSDPLLNEVVNTTLYDHDEKLTFFENFMQNAKENGLLLQMGIGGLASSIATVWTGYKGLKNSNVDVNNTLTDTLELNQTLELTITEEIPTIRELTTREIELKREELDELLQNDDIRKLRDMFNGDENIDIPSHLKDDFERLKILQKEIEYGTGALTENEINILNKRLIESLKGRVDSDVSPNVLSDTELQVKRLELSRLYEKNYYIYDYLMSGKLDSLVDDEHALLISKALVLKTEIDSGVGKLNLEEQNLVKLAINNQLAGRMLKNDLLISVEGIDDPILKARKLYMELAKKLHYSMEYRQGGELTKNRIYNDFMTFNNLNENHTVICKGWAELYYELLTSAGFSRNQVRIMMAKSNLSHNWVEINFGDRVLIADATENIRGRIDLSASKGGMSTHGFMLLDSSYSGGRINTMLKRDMIPSDYLEQHDKWMLSVDQQLGYANQNGYAADQIVRAKGLFSNNQLVQKLFGNTTSSMIDKIVSLDVPEGMDGYEAYAYYKNVFSKVDGALSSVTLKTIYIEKPTMVEPILTMSYVNSKSENIFVFIGEKCGKILVKGKDEYLRVLNELNKV